ncbi:MAG: hypothetical protein Q7R98_03680 [Candidatus Jorgensenbacteria bacterium]|nr:hypothetical protein [Candidatus Jorgensenbacteria bacterium]
MRASTKRILSIGLAGVFFLGAFLTYSWFIQGEMQTVNEKRAELGTKEALFKNQNDAIGQVQSAFSQFQNAQDVKKKVELAIPSGVDTISALRQIEAISNRTGVTLTSLGFKEAASRPAPSTFFKKIGVLEVTLGAAGSYEALRQFLQLFETNARIVNVQEFKYQSALGQGNGQQRAGGPEQMDIKVEMYYQE